MSKTLNKATVKRLNREFAKTLTVPEIVFLLQDVTDPINVGSLFRTADALQANLMLCGQTPVPPNSGISLTARGLERSVSWEYAESAEQAISTLKTQGYEIVGVEIAESAESFFEHKFRPKTCLILGNEAIGIYKKILSLCDAVVSLPMLGKGQSLNVQVAGSVIGYQIINQFNSR